MTNTHTPSTNGTRVVSTYDDGDRPIVGTVVEWIGDEECIVDWPDLGHRREYADTLMSWRPRR